MTRASSSIRQAEFQLLPLQHTQATLICLKAGIWRLFPRDLFSEKLQVDSLIGGYGGPL